MADTRLSGPDALTIGRTVLAAVAGCAAVAVAASAGWQTGAGARATIAAALAVSAMADAVDGTWARRSGTASAQGARLDTAADLVLAVAMLASVVTLVRTPAPWFWTTIAAVAAMRAAVALLARIRWGAWLTVHTWPNKAAGVAAAAAVLAAILAGRVVSWMAIAACAVAAIAAADEALCILRNPTARSDVRLGWRA